MLFNSFNFLLFFLITTGCWLLTKPVYRWMVLLPASCVFYAFAIPAYLPVLFFIILIDFFSAIAMSQAGDKAKKFYLAASLGANLGVLFLFKYHDFFSATLNGLSGTERFSLWHLALPIGLSFHTFQAMGYTIDVYRGRKKPERHLGYYALFVLFYPQLVAGPVERAGHLLPQLKKPKPVCVEDMAAGLKWMLWGYFLKTVLADRLGIYVDYVFLHPETHGRAALAIAVLFYSFQIYGDFAGYSLIALGAARCMGIFLTANFRRPYLASSLSEFWRRWHISLSTWFRDYVYFPLGGNRVTTVRWIFNILVVFILSGLWHGANLTFLLWGFIHACLLLVSRFFNRHGRPTRWRVWTGTGLTFIFVSLAWIFFRSRSLSQATLFLRRLFDPATRAEVGGEFDERALLITGFAAIALVLTTEILAEFLPAHLPPLRDRRVWIRLPACIALVLVIVLFGVFDGSQFIYFQF